MVSEVQVGLIWGCLSFSFGQWMCTEIPLSTKGFLLLRGWGYLSVFGVAVGGLSFLDACEEIGFGV